MQRGNVLVIGNSGVGKSTLINAVLGEECAKTGWGTKGTTTELTMWENDIIPFRLIDTVGFEPSFIKEHRAINAVRKWSSDCAKNGREDNQINVIWYCVEGTSSKLFSKSIKTLSRATSIWNSVPIIVVITKSYSVPDRITNTQMVTHAFAKNRQSCNVRRIIPVVASAFILNDNAFAPPEGITQLIDATNELMPEGLQAGQHDLALFKVSRKRALAHSVVAIAASAGVVVGAVPVPFADAMILTPIEIVELNALAQIYGINKDEKSKQFFSSIVEAGTISTAAKAAISAIKAIPGINIGASLLNAVIAGSIVASLGEGTIYIFEQVCLGKNSITDIEWVKKVMESKLSVQMTQTVNNILTKINDKTDIKTIAPMISEMFKDKLLS